MNKKLKFGLINGLLLSGAMWFLLYLIYFSFIHDELTQMQVFKQTAWAFIPAAMLVLSAVFITAYKEA